MRARGANRRKRPYRATVVIGFPSRRSEPMRHHRVRLAAVSGESSSMPPCVSGGGHLPEIDVVLPNGPDDAGQLVGKCNGGLVVAAERLEVQSPGAQMVGGATLLGGRATGASAMNEKHAEVEDAALADGAEQPERPSRGAR